MNSYFATFPAGCYEIIARQLKAFRPDELKILLNDESSVMFDSPLPVEKFIEARYFTNVYLLIDKPVPTSTFKGKYFRLMMLREGEPTPLGSNDRQVLEEKIKKEYGLIPDSRLSLNDFYVIERSNGSRLLGLRLSRAKFKREKLSEGELRPELAHVLCLIAGLKAKDTLLDMFAGYGSIPYEAVRGFGCRQVIAVDNQKLPNRHEHPAIRWHEAEADKLSFLQDASVDRIISDPPWGEFAKASASGLENLYRHSLEEARRLLKDGGVAVFLSGSSMLDDMILANKAFDVLKTYHILVSGKKARIFKLQKTR